MATMRGVTVYVVIIPNDYRYATVDVFASKEEAKEYIKEEKRSGTDVANAIIQTHDLSVCADEEVE